MMLLILLAAAVFSAPSKVAPDKGSVDSHHSSLAARDECLSECFDERDDKMARCVSLPRRQRPSCKKNALRSVRVCRMECVEQ